MFHIPAHKQTDPSKRPGQVVNPIRQETSMENLRITKMHANARAQGAAQAEHLLCVHAVLALTAFAHLHAENERDFKAAASFISTLAVSANVTPEECEQFLAAADADIADLKASHKEAEQTIQSAARH